MTTTSLAARIDELTDAGLDEDAIAAELGVPVARIVRILDQTVGLQPGETLPPIKAEARTRPPVVKPDGFTHGTISGWQSHKRHGQEPCDECKTGAREYWAARKKPKPAKTRPEPKPRILVRWLTPAGPDGDTAIEYGVPESLGRIRPISAKEAALRTADGERIVARRVTPWAPIPDPERRGRAV